jgi:hypothetical protein
MFAYIFISLNIFNLKTFKNNISKLELLMNRRFKEIKKIIAVLKDKIRKLEDWTSVLSFLILPR